MVKYSRRFGYKRRTRSYYRGYYRGKYRSYYRSKYRFANGSSKSSIRVKIPFNAVINIGFTLNSLVSNTEVINPFATNTTALGDGTVGSPCGPQSSPLYARFADLYDEVKCEGMKLKFNCLTPIGANAADSITFVTAIDRKNTFADLQAAYPTADQLLTYSSASRYVALNNSVPKMKRSVYASDLAEKSTFIDSDIANYANVSINGGVFTVPLTANAAWHDAGSTLTAFSPSIFLAATRTSTPAINYQVAVEGFVYYTFRNPKFGASLSSRSAPTPSLPPSTTDEMTS